MRELIKHQLDTRNLVNVLAILRTKEGREFFSWLLQECGRDTCDFKGNSRDVFMAGMRNVAMIVIACFKALDLTGIDLMHLAEREYVVLQKEIAEEIRQRNRERK